MHYLCRCITNSTCRYPKIFEDETVGPEAKKLFSDAEVALMLK